MRYVLVTNRRPFGFGHGVTGVMVTLTLDLPVTSNAPGRKPITSCPSSVNAEVGSLEPLMILMFSRPELGCELAPAWGGGQTKLYGWGGVNLSLKLGATLHDATMYATAALTGCGVRVMV